MLSIIITCHNDAEELGRTVQGICDTTSPDQREIIVVDDCSRGAVAFDSRFVLIRNSKRIGVGPSRHIGAMEAKGDWLLFMDAHMRFETGWLDRALVSLKSSNDSATLYCARCVPAEAHHVRIDDIKACYWGANFHVHGQHPRTGKVQTFCGIWADPPSPGVVDPEIQCVMGASYFIHHFHYFRLDPLRHLRGWGLDEEMLSLKMWLSGGTVRLLSDVRIGHVWRKDQKKLPYALMEWEIMYNRLFAIHTLLPPNMATKIISCIPHTPYKGKAIAQINLNWSLVEIEQRRNASIFQHDFAWYCSRMGLSFPQ